MEIRLFAELEREIERLRRRYALFLREMPAARELPSRWLISAGSLHWIVALEEILEPDVDIEIGADVLVVRAVPPNVSSARAFEQGFLVALLPVPPGFDVRSPSIRFSHGLLEIRVSRARESAR